MLRIYTHFACGNGMEQIAGKKKQRIDAGGVLFFVAQAKVADDNGRGLTTVSK